MGKGTIVNHIANGQYNVTVNYNRVDLIAAIAALEARETLLIDAIAAETDDLKKELLRLQLVSVQKRIEYLEDTDHVPADDTITAWCADLTTDLTEGVGLIEIGREQANGVNIQPGFEGNAVFDADRDGQLTPFMAQDPAATFYNLAMLPGTQKWKPTYLYGEITAIDHDLNTCSVTIDAVSSSQQALSIINGAYGINDVPVNYMDCNSSAFKVGDRVLVFFEGYDWTAPKVIGFESEPKACCWIEPWETIDGEGNAVAYSLITDKYAWLNKFEALWSGGLYTYGDGSSAGVGLADNDGYLEINVSPYGTGDATTTATNYLSFYGNAVQLVNVLPANIKEKVSRVMFDAEGEAQCYSYRFRHEYKLELHGQNADSEEVKFEIVIVWTSPYYFTRIGCSDTAIFDVETDWVSRVSDGVTVYRKNILNNNTDYITLPITNVTIYAAYIYVLQTNEVSGTPPLSSWTLSDSANLKINRIEIC